MAGNVVRHVLVGIREKVNRLFLEARPVEHADGERQRHVAGSRILIDVEMTERNEGRRNGDGHLVASPGIIGALNADDDVFEVTRGIQHVAGRAVERVGIDIARGGDFGAGEDPLGKNDALEAVDLHVVAQLIGKRHVTRRVLGTLDDISGMTGRTHDVLRDSTEDILEVVGIRRRLIEVRVSRARTKLVILRCGGIVAGHGVQELVLLRSSPAVGVNGRIGAILDANGVDGGSAVLKGLSGGNGRVGNGLAEAVALSRRTVREEHDNLLCTRARVVIECLFGLAHTLVGAGGASRLDRVDAGGNGPLAVLRASGEPKHALTVVVFVASRPVGIVAGALRAVAGKLHHGDAMLLVCVRDTLVCLRDFVDEGVGGSLERIDALGGVTVAHRIVHRARGVEDKDDIQRRRGRHRQVRRRGDGGE